MYSQPTVFVFVKESAYRLTPSAIRGAPAPLAKDRTTMVRHFETATHDGSAVRVSIDSNIAWAVIGEGPHAMMVREYGIAIPCGGSFERYADDPDFVVRYVEREDYEPGDDIPFDSEELIQMYRPDTGIGFEWRLIFSEWSKWDRIAGPTEAIDDVPTITRDLVAVAEAAD